MLKSAFTRWFLTWILVWFLAALILFGLSLGVRAVAATGTATANMPATDAHFGMIAALRATGAHPRLTPVALASWAAIAR